MSVSLSAFLPAADAGLFSGLPDGNTGGNQNIFIGLTSTSRAILKFDVSAIPVSAKILEATLRIVVNQAPTAPVPAYTIDRTTRTNWVENQVTWNSWSTGNAWTTGGGDFTTEDEGSYSAPGGAGELLHTDANIIAQIQDAVRLTSDRFASFLIIPDSATGQFRIAMKENATSADRPTLAITYVVPKRRGLLGVGR